MNKEEYAEYLKTPTWAKIRQARMELDGFHCVICGNTGTQVHHLNYLSAGGAEDIEHDLVTLCRECHRTVHELMDEAKAETEIIRAESDTAFSGAIASYQLCRTLKQDVAMANKFRILANRFGNYKPLDGFARHRLEWSFYENSGNHVTFQSTIVPDVPSVNPQKIRKVMEDDQKFRKYYSDCVSSSLRLLEKAGLKPID